MRSFSSSLPRRAGLRKRSRDDSCGTPAGAVDATGQAITRRAVRVYFEDAGEAAE